MAVNIHCSVESCLPGRLCDGQLIDIDGGLRPAEKDVARTDNPKSGRFRLVNSDIVIDGNITAARCEGQNVIIGRIGLHLIQQDIAIIGGKAVIPDKYQQGIINLDDRSRFRRLDICTKMDVAAALEKYLADGNNTGVYKGRSGIVDLYISLCIDSRSTVTIVEGQGTHCHQSDIPLPCGTGGDEIALSVILNRIRRGIPEHLLYTCGNRTYHQIVHFGKMDSPDTGYRARCPDFDFEGTVTTTGFARANRSIQAQTGCHNIRVRIAVIQYTACIRYQAHIAVTRVQAPQLDITISVIANITVTGACCGGAVLHGNGTARFHIDGSGSGCANITIGAKIGIRFLSYTIRAGSSYMP